MPIRTLSSRVVYRNKWMTVQEDAIARQDGSRGLYGLVLKPDFSLIIPRAPDGFYLVEQYRYPIRGCYPEFPQGSWEEDGDAPPKRVAEGELREETGLIAGRMTYLGHLFVAHGYSNQGAHIFLAEDLVQGPADPGLEECDLVCRKVPFGQFETLIRAGRIKDSATVAAYGLLCLRDKG